MSGGIKVDGKIHSFEQFAEYANLSQGNKHLEDVKGFVRSWLSGQESFQIATSGSTGKPKLIDISRSRMIASARMTADALNLQAGNSALLCMNPQMIGGKMMLVRAMELGLELSIVPASSNPSDHLDADARFDFAAFVPLQIVELLKSDEGRELLNNIKTMIIGGGALDETTEKAFQEVSASAYSTYGMTETVSHVALKRLNGPERSENFRLLDGIEAQLDGRGCLSIKGQVTRNDWLQTNDIVEFQGSRAFKWLGRIDNVINTGGVKVQIESLEQAIRKLLENDQIMISSMPDVKFGEVIVMLSEDPFSQKQQEQLKMQLPKFHCPKVFLTVDKLPQTPSGKPDRQQAKALASSSA